MSRRPLAVVAVGGNALIRDREHLSIPDQYQQVVVTAGHIAGMIEAGYDVIVTHGNGPQMGFILRRSELAIDEVAHDLCERAAEIGRGKREQGCCRGCEEAKREGAVDDEGGNAGTVQDVLEIFDARKPFGLRAARRGS